MDPDSPNLRDEFYARLRDDAVTRNFMLEDSLSGTWYLDPENPHAAWFSPRFRALFGYSETETVKDVSNWSKRHLHPSDYDRAMEELRRVAEHPGQQSDGVYRCQDRNGSTLWVRSRSMAISDEGGKTCRLIGTCQDLTEWKEVQHELTLRQTITQLVAAAPTFNEALEDFIRVVCEESEMACGEAWARPDNEQLLGQAASWHDPSDSRAGAAGKFLASSREFVFSPGTSVVGRVWRTSTAEWHEDLTDLDEEYFTRRDEALAAGIHTVCVIPVETGGEMQAAIAFYSHATIPEDARMLRWLVDLGTTLGPAFKQQLLEESARASGEIARGVVETVRQPLLILDATFRVVQTNLAFCELFGLDAREVVGAYLFGLNKQAWDIPQLRILLAEILPRNSHVRNFSVKQSFPSVGDKSLILDARRISFEDEPTHYILLAIEDLTEKQMLEEQLRQSQRMEAIGRLAGGIAHDFNNQLTAIMGFTDLAIEQLPADHPTLDSLEEIRLATNRSAEITRGLLAFSRKQLLTMLSINLNEVLTGMEVFLSRLLGEDIDLEFKMQQGLQNINGDRAQIEQVIVNLAINARDAMPDGGKLLIETSSAKFNADYISSHLGVSAGEHVMLAVTDSGEGMEAEVASQIFEPFFTTKEIGKGTGLGLSTVHGIVRQHGGIAWVYSEPGQGATFKLYFPVAQTAEQRPTSESKVPTELRGEETILYVEDNESVRRLFDRALHSMGYTVISTSDPKDALNLVEREQFPVHMVITDFVMPGMNGTQLTSALRRHIGKTPVLYLSGYTENAVMHGDALDEEYAFLGKPVSTRALLEKVRAMLDKARD